MFVSHSTHYEFNVADGSRIKAKRAALTTPDGDLVPAIAAFSGRSVKFIIPIADALRLSNEIVDAIESA